MSPLKTGDCSILTFRSVYSFSHSAHLVTDVDIFGKHESVRAVEDALVSILHPKPVQLGPSGSSEASRQILVEKLPPVLVLHLKRFLYDVAADGIVKINKAVQFAPELEIPLGAIFFFVSFVLARAEFPVALPVQKSWHPLPGNLQSRRTTSSMERFTTTAIPQAAGIIRPMCSTRPKAVVVWNLGCALMMKL